jgi:hypothetical protein
MIYRYASNSLAEMAKVNSTLEWCYGARGTGTVRHSTSTSRLCVCSVGDSEERNTG